MSDAQTPPPSDAPAAKEAPAASEPAPPVVEEQPVFEKIEMPEPVDAAPGVPLPRPLFGPGVSNGVLALLMPLIGALPPRSLRAIEEARGDRGFSARQAALANIVINFFLYAAIGLVAGRILSGGLSFGGALIGFGYGLVEGLLRYAGGPLWYRGSERGYILGAWYTLPVTIYNTARAAWITRHKGTGNTPFAHTWHDGVPVGEQRPMVNLELERDRQRRYGNVLRLRETKDGAEVELELPRWAPEHPALEELGIERELPHYEWQVTHAENLLQIRARLPESPIRRLSGRLNSLPGGFYKQVVLPERISAVEASYDPATRVLHIKVQTAGDAGRVFDPFEGVGDAVRKMA